MASNSQQNILRSWTLADTILEFYGYAPGVADALPKHVHEEYQFCFSVDFPGEYYYRGTFYAVPTTSLSVIHPDEVHSARDVDDRPTFSSYRVMYIKPEMLQRLASEIGDRATSYPFFPTPIILDPDLAHRYMRLHLAVEEGNSALEQEERLLSVLEQFMLRYAEIRPTPRAIGSEQQRVRRVREYLAEHLTENIYLAQLSELVNLSPYHLSRVFAQEVGLPPHRYQIQLRVARARILLSQGLSLQTVAEQTGFADQNHLARHFKRLLRVTPGHYAAQNSKIVRDTNDE
ncbi:AraC family transcriptional regulator [Candidatus Gracilibacteria bacterium]|nr:AraC family transcriptional regulator [Candidatus Gracilibacteria bacterium]NJP21383.1 AraC family transcriptional regulator [Hydrococcus sp. CRU_1_1]